MECHIYRQRNELVRQLRDKTITSVGKTKHEGQDNYTWERQANTTKDNLKLSSKKQHTAVRQNRIR